MTHTFSVELRLKLIDAGTAAGIKSVEQAVTQAITKTVTATEKAAQKAAEAEEKGAARQRTSHERLSRAREVLGIRPEQAIQREIQQTEAAYQRLTSAGVLSAEQQGRALDATRKKVTALTNEMGKLTAEQQKQERLSKGLRVGGIVAAGGAAALYTMKGPVMTAMSYDERIANMANTAFSGQRDAAGRKMGMKTLEDAVNQARKTGGGSRDQAAEALDTMIASNAVPIEDAMKILPLVVKQARAAKADPNDIALMAVRAMQIFKIPADELEAMMSGAQIAGQKGSFELPNMAKWLPEQMAMAKQLGISGKDGMSKLLGWNQAAAITAGSKDQAGNNVRDLLNELNTPHFRNFMAQEYLANGQKAKKGEKEKRSRSMDDIYLDYQSRGVDKVTATIEMMNTVFSRDKKYQELQAELKGLGAKDPKRKEILESMAAQVQGTEVGKVFHNQQSLMAFLGIAGNTDLVAEVNRATIGQYKAPKDQLESSISHSVISDTASYQMEQAQEDKAMSQKQVLDNLTPAIGRAAQAFSDLASKHPMLIGTTTLATAALGAFAGAAGLASLAMGKGIPGASLPSSGAIGRYGAVGLAGAVGYGAGTLIYDNLLAGNSAGDMIGRGLARIPAFFGSKEAQDAIRAEYEFEHDSTRPAKYSAPRDNRLGSGTATLFLQDFSAIKDQLKPAEQKPVDVNAKIMLGLAPGLVLQSQSMRATGGSVTMNTGNLFHGAP